MNVWDSENDRFCPNDHKLSWADRRFGCAKCGKRKCRKAKIRFTQRHDYKDYREDLARFPGDPEAYVDSPTAVNKLIDKRKRDGWVMGRLDEATVPGDKNEDPIDGLDAREQVEQAFHEVMNGELKGI